MIHSESVKAIAPALVKAQKEITSALKDADNPFFKSKYADLASIITAVKGPLNNYGIAILQGVTTSANAVQVETLLMHETGEFVSNTIELPVKVDKGGSATAQDYGSAITYAKRYGLQSLVGVPSEDDDGNAASGKEKYTGPLPAAMAKGDAMQVAKTEFEALPLSEKPKYLQYASDIIAQHKAGGNVHQTIEALRLSNDGVLALWSLLPSDVRTAAKRQKEAAALGSKS